MRSLAALLVCGVLVLSGCSSAGTGEKKQAAERLPDVTLKALSGSGSLDLSSVRGPAVVNVWASWCKPCRKELPLYQSFSRRHAGQVKVLGIDFQDPRADAARQLVATTGVRYPLYADPLGRLRARALPQVIFVDAEGRITHQEYVEIKTSAQLDELAATHLGIGS